MIKNTKMILRLFMDSKRVSKL